jgi:hypothetical protein
MPQSNRSHERRKEPISSVVVTTYSRKSMAACAEFIAFAISGLPCELRMRDNLKRP